MSSGGGPLPIPPFCELFPDEFDEFIFLLAFYGFLFEKFLLNRNENNKNKQGFPVLYLKSPR
jgi:hypothetical protein